MKRAAIAVLLLLFALPAAAAPPRELAYQDAWPVWSPDGTKIAFTRLHVPRALAELEVVDVRTHRVTKLAQASYQLAPSWSPDGSHIAFQANGDVYETDLDGAKRRVGKGLAPAYGDSLARLVGSDLYVGGRVWARKVFGRPAWSPDRRQLAFQRADGIFVTDGAGETPVGAAAGPEPGPPVWSADGARLAWVQGDGLWVATLATGSVAEIGPQVHELAGPVWEPGGKSLIATTWLGVVRFFLDGRTQTLHSPSGQGVSVSRSGRLAYVGRRPQCPGHFGVVAGATVLTGTCTIRGTSAADVIEGTSGPGDVIAAGPGDDKVHANDRHADRIDCGAGKDEVWADRRDSLSHCEVVHR